MNKLIRQDNIKIERTERFGPFYISVAVKEGEKAKGYGISKCSDTDYFRSEIGVKTAEGRARKALFKKLNGKRIKKIHEVYLG